MPNPSSPSPPEAFLNPRLTLTHRSYIRSIWLTCRIGEGEARRVLDGWGMVLPPVLPLLQQHPRTAPMLRGHKRYFWLVLGCALTGGVLTGFSIGFLKQLYLTAPQSLEATKGTLCFGLGLAGLLAIGTSFLFSCDSFRCFLLMIDTYNAHAAQSRPPGL